MRNSDDLLQRRRELLLARSSLLRATWSLQVQALHRPLQLVDRTRDSVDWLVRHPQWPLAAGLGIALLRPRGIARLASRAWWGWTLFRRARQLLAQI
jgi:hypothetical protein